MMERALKERIIGAIILVIIVVLVVPVFLDGPPDNGEIVSERVLLPGQEGQDTKTVVLNRERSEPIPLASSSTDAPKTGGAVEAEPEKETPVPQLVVQKPAVRTACAQWSSPRRSQRLKSQRQHRRQPECGPYNSAAFQIRITPKNWRRILENKATPHF